MAALRQVRELNANDRRRLDDVLERFRTEFAAWADNYSNLWELLAFVQYEGIELPIVDEAEPLIKGQRCVTDCGAQWRMLAVGDEWHFSIAHDDFDMPIDLTKFKKKQLERTLSRKWKRLLIAQDEAS